MTVFAAASTARTMDFEEGDVGYIPISNPHYVENTGDSDLVFLEMFKTGEYQDISLAEWMAHTPRLLMNQHLAVGMEMLARHRSGSGSPSASSHILAMHRMREVLPSARWYPSLYDRD